MGNATIKLMQTLCHVKSTAAQLRFSMLLRKLSQKMTYFVTSSAKFRQLKINSIQLQVTGNATAFFVNRYIA